jgi:diguanylate cyclase (GGDEF)-like protein/PAS domain S-box-containing protein
VFRSAALDNICARLGARSDRAWTLPMCGSAVICLVSVVTIWTGTAYIVGEDFRRSRETAAHDTANLARAFDEHIVQSLHALDQTLLLARDAYLRDGTRFDLPHWTVESKFRTDVAFNISIADRTGRIVFSNVLSDPVNIGDREYFRIQSESHADDLLLGKPMTGRITRRPMLTLSRPITDGSGFFAGAIILSIDPSYFTSFYRSVDLGARGLVQLVGTDGTVRAGVADSSQRAGQSLAGSMLFEKVAERPTGSFVGADATDAVVRIASYRTIPAYALVVVVGLSLDEVLAAPVRSRNIALFGASVLSMLVLAFTTATLRGQYRLNTSEFKFRSMFEVAPVGIALISTTGQIHQANGAFARLADHPEPDLRGRRIQELLEGPNGGCFATCPEANRNGTAPPRECSLRRRDGTLCTVLCNTTRASAADPLVWVTLQDISERKRAESKIWDAAHRDTLTELPNRLYLSETLDELLAAPDPGRPLGLLLLDIDNFKVVNDTLGHEAGDLLLRKAAERLQRVRTQSDFVARYGGDEFAVVVRDFGNEKNLMRIARRLLRTLGRRVVYRGQTIEMHSSIGIAVAPKNGTERSDLLRRADLALYRAKHQGRNRAVMFEPAMLAEAEHQYRTVTLFHRAVEEGRIVPVYQPQVDLVTGEIVGVEALARIDDGELLPPAAFAAAFRDGESCRLLGRQMLDRVTRDLARWRAADLSLRIAVNASSFELTEDSYAERLLALLKERGIRFEDIEIEVTETSVLDDSVPAVGRNLGILSSHGVSVALDDFGTGYAALSHLKSLPITRVKIDRSFIANITSDRESRAIVAAVVRLSHSLGKTVVAEGIENAEQLEELRTIECDAGQGFAIARPMRAEDIGTFVLRNLAERGARAGGELFDVAIAAAAP